MQTVLIPLKEEVKSTIIVEQENTKREYTYQLYKDSNVIMTDTKALVQDTPNCVWVEGEQDGLYGIQKVVSVNNSNALTALPTLKDLEKLEIGKCYKLLYKGLVDLGGYCKKIIEVEEIDNKTYEILSINYNERDEISNVDV